MAQNRYRYKHGSPPFVLNDVLSEGAQKLLILYLSENIDQKLTN